METESKFSNLEGPERLIGSRVLEFELTAVLGSGGMSVVYRGRHRVTGQEVAIEVLPPELAQHDELKARFVEEARALAMLEHPAIVALNNFVEAGGRLCLIMQFVDGVTLEHKIVGAGKLPWTETLRVGVEVLKALEYAHARQVIHRDIKPSNILVRADGSVKVTDFGIAKILGASRLTGTGQTMGTVRYMSPEQVRGKQVGASSDYYSLGVTLYEALAGHTPFEGENQFDIMQQHLNRKPPALASFGARVPAPVEKALQHAMEKDPKDRYRDATEFRVALEAALALANDPKQLARARSAERVRTISIGLGLAVAVAGAAGAGWLGWRSRPSNRTTSTVEKRAAPKPSFVPPHQVPGLSLAVDQTWEADGVRIQASMPIDAVALRDRYRLITRALVAFFRAEPDLKAVADAPVLPLTIVIAPQSVLDDPKRWPGYAFKPDTSYPSRYVSVRRTLFVANAPGFESNDLPYGVALHALARIQSLSNDRLYSLAEKFQASYNTTAPK